MRREDLTPKDYPKGTRVKATHYCTIQFPAWKGFVGEVVGLSLSPNTCRRIKWDLLKTTWTLHHHFFIATQTQEEDTS